MVAYHRDFEAAKGKHQGAGADDKNMQAALATQKKTTNLGYNTAPSEVAAAKPPAVRHAGGTERGCGGAL